jgi:hypothetical protein
MDPTIYWEVVMGRYPENIVLFWCYYSESYGNINKILEHWWGYNEKEFGDWIIRFNLFSTNALKFIII